MANTFGVFKGGKKSGFKVPEDKSSAQKRRVVSTRHSGTPNRSHASGAKAKARRTLYSETINIDRTGSVDPAQYASSQIDYIRAAKKKKMRISIILACLLAAVLIVLLAYGCMRIFLRVGRIEVVGIDKYDPGEIIETTGISVGDNLFAVDRGAIAKELGAKYPYLKNVRIVREIPDGIVISAEEDTPKYCSSFGGQCFILSDSFRLLERTADIESAKILHGQLLEITLPGVKRAIIGEEVVFVSERYSQIVPQVVSDVLSSERADLISYIDIENRYHVNVYYDNRITVKLGDDKNIPQKLRFAYAIIDDFGDHVKGEVSAQSVESGYADLK